MTYNVGDKIIVRPRLESQDLYDVPAEFTGAVTVADPDDEMPYRVATPNGGDIWFYTDEIAPNIEKKVEVVIQKIKLSTGVEGSIGAYGSVKLPGDYMTNTSFLDAAGVTYEVVPDIEEIAFEDIGRNVLGRQTESGETIHNVDMYDDSVEIYAGDTYQHLRVNEALKVYK